MLPLPPGAFEANNWLVRVVPATSDQAFQPVAAVEPGFEPEVIKVVEPRLNPELVRRFGLSAKTVADESVTAANTKQTFSNELFMGSWPHPPKRNRLAIPLRC